MSPRPAKQRRSTKAGATAKRPPPRPTRPPSAPGARAAKEPIPIVGIGASAGGLEALEAFFKNMPPESGLAFVVVQHLDPTHKGMLVELLQRATTMPVAQASDRLPVAPDHVYVIPPGKDLALARGLLKLLPQKAPRGLNLPIDVFLRSLAEDQQERSIGVVLSGMGTDGTLGLRAIKEKAGASFVQAIASAKFDGMPRSAIEAGVADVVAAVEELPAKIVSYHRHVPHIGAKDAEREGPEGGEEIGRASCRERV